MKIGFLSDAHGNPEGVAVCLDVLRRAGADKVFFLGDAVGYLSGWGDVLSLLFDNGVRCLRGNHDQAVLSGQIEANGESVYQLYAEFHEQIRGHRQWMSEWPIRLDEDFCGYRITMVHGSPRAPLSGYVYPWTELSTQSDFDADVILMGHTHRPFVREIGGKLIINVGSCGLPRDVGNLACCATFDCGKREAKVFRVMYSVEKLLARVRIPHPEVLRCLERRTENYVGELVSEIGK